MKNSSPNAEATDHTTSHEGELPMRRTLLSAEREGKVLLEDDVFASLKGLAAQARLRSQASAAEKQHTAVRLAKTCTVHAHTPSRDVDRATASSGLWK